MLTPLSYTNINPSFGVNLKSPRLRLSQKDFFIKIRGYGRNTKWANEVKKTTDEAVGLIREKCDSDNVLFRIAQGVKNANLYPTDLMLRKHTGVLRVPLAGWEHESDWSNQVITTPFTINKYKSYQQRLKSVKEKPLEKPYNDIGLARIGKTVILHPAPSFIQAAFKHVEKLYAFIQNNFIKKEIETKDLTLLNDAVAEIRWILAHSMPWERGTDSISNVFMRAIYKACGVKAYPPAKGTSFDLEAFCTNLNEYKKNFPNFFENPPEVVE